VERRRSALLLLTLAACSSSEPPPKPECAPGKLVLGLQGQPGLAGIVNAVRVSTSVDGVARPNARFAVTDPAPILPQEIAIESDGRAKQLEVRVDGFDNPAIGADPQPSDPKPLITRIASAPFACGETRLVRLRLEGQCLTAGFPGAFGPTCTAPQSCQAGRCVDGTLLPQDLEPYSPTWALDTPDACKPPGAGAPEVILGTGQTDFHVLGTEPMKPEKGPQGGHHLWIAVRMKNLKQAGSTTTITGVAPEAGLTIPVTSFVFTFDRDEGGYCKLFGLRYQLDNASAPVERFLGQPLDVTVEVRDVAGTSAKATARIQVADSVIVPAGL